MGLWEEQYATNNSDGLIPRVEQLLVLATSLLDEKPPTEHYVDRYEIHYAPDDKGYEEVAELRTLGYWRERLREQVSNTPGEPTEWSPQLERSLDFYIGKVSSLQDQASRYGVSGRPDSDLHHVYKSLTLAIEETDALIDRLESQQSRELRQEYEQTTIPAHLRELIAKRVQWLDMDFTGALEELVHVINSASRVREELDVALAGGAKEGDSGRLCELGQMMAHRLTEMGHQMQIATTRTMQTFAEQLNPDTWAELALEEHAEE